MKKVIILLALFGLSKFGNSQVKKDTAKQELDTAYVISMKDMAQLKSILLESAVMVNGKQMTGKELISLMQWIDSHAQVFKKEQPK
jgi:hypothetical protein